MSEAQYIDTRDYWTIIALEFCGHVAEKITMVEGKDNRNNVLIYRFPEEAADDFDAWVRGEIRDSFEAIRKVRNSQRQFKSNLSRLST